MATADIAPGPARRSHWEVAVLAFLREEPMHPYQMQRLLRERHKDELLALKRGSLYHAIAQLAKAGLIEPVGTDREGRRPERTTYRLTPEGAGIFDECLRLMLAVPRLERSEFFAGLSFLVYLSPAEAAGRLADRASRLESEIAQLTKRQRAARGRVERINLIEEEYLAAMWRAELRWVRGVLDELRSGRFSWRLEEILRQPSAAASGAVSGK
jgi:DNA-binding PadR family transcriptional regulator